ncbi:amidohydrolase [Daldinia caldariorum]|uniref:amidohydrolase n=1 Tax=Daldinia caldariorum TaxID=326644 RepID=UPI0020089C94|nr:amidohydrolase [Daldinia caldariorum]KAI1471275.1 amidohydrolase [Daldinia caldariorum]
MTRRTIPPQPEPLPKHVFSTGFGIAIRTRSEEGDDHHHASPSSHEKKPVATIIATGLLIPGDGPPLKDAALVIENKLIAWVGPQSDLPPEYTDGSSRLSKSYSVPYLMPGLWDCHAHFFGIGAGAGGYLTIITDHPAASGARLAKGCWEALQRGYTSLRDLAGYGCEVARAIDEGAIVGPNVYSAGACISQTGGHGDVFELPAGDALLNLGVAHVAAGHFGTATSILADGVDECRKAVRLQIRRGARVVKVIASGGVMSRDDDPLCAQFSAEELRTIVEEAGRQNRVVAAHVHGKPGIMAAVRAGVATVEHVSFADQECIDLIKEKGTVYVATRTVVELLLLSGGKGLPRQQWEKAQLIGNNNFEAYKLAVKAGVPIALGTDTAPGFNMAMELEYAVQAGLSNLEAIKAATANGPLTVKGQAPKTGQLKVGYEADILGLLKDPVEDVKVLQEKATIGWVWKGGKVYKGPGVGPWGEES